MPRDFLLDIDRPVGESKDKASGRIDLPIADFTTIAAADLDRCTTGDLATICDKLVFQTTSYPVYDVIFFHFTDLAGGNPGFSTFEFAEGSFDAVGRYTSIDGNTTLRLSAVPEAATWLMLIMGFGLVGTMLRRKRLRAV